MGCHWKKSTPSLKHYDMKGIGGHQSSGSIFPRKMENKGRLASLSGATNCCKKSYEAFCKSITNRSSANTHMVSDQSVDVIRLSEKSSTNGLARAGLSREISL